MNRIIFAVLVFAVTLLPVELPAKSLKPQAYKPGIHTPALKHIKKRHAWNTPHDHTSKFYPHTSDQKIKNLVVRAYQSDKGHWQPSKSTPGRLTKDYRFKKSIGVKTDGTATKTLRVVSDHQGNIITAFPR